MSTPSSASAPVRLTVALCWALMAVQLLLLGVVLLDWGRGEPELYPGQYISRLLGAASGVALMGALLVAHAPSYRTFRGRLLFWLLLGGSMAVLATRLITGL